MLYQLSYERRGVGAFLKSPVLYNAGGDQGIPSPSSMTHEESMENPEFYKTNHGQDPQTP
jgi:hypothetical protein